MVKLLLLCCRQIMSPLVVPVLRFVAAQSCIVLLRPLQTGEVENIVYYFFLGRAEPLVADLQYIIPHGFWELAQRLSICLHYPHPLNGRKNREGATG